jgi:hypothetical protein
LILESIVNFYFPHIKGLKAKILILYLLCDILSKQEETKVSDDVYALFAFEIDLNKLKNEELNII